MTLEHLSEQALIETSRLQREAWDLSAAVRERFAGHALSVNRPDVAADFLPIAGALDVAAECSERLTQIEVAA